MREGDNNDPFQLVAIYPTSLTPYYVYKFRLNKLLSKPMDFRLVLRDLKPGNKLCIDGKSKYIRSHLQARSIFVDL